MRGVSRHCSLVRGPCPASHLTFDWAQLQVRGLVQAEQSIKASVDPGEPEVQEMVETVLTPTHPDPFEALLDEPFTRTFDHATAQR